MARTVLLTTGIGGVMLIFWCGFSLFLSSPPSVVKQAASGVDGTRQAYLPQPYGYIQSKAPSGQRGLGAANEGERLPSARIGLIMLVLGSSFPPWWPFLVMSYAHNPICQLIVVHTGDAVQQEQQQQQGAEGGHVLYKHVPLQALKVRFMSKIGASAVQVDAKLASGKGLSDLKPLYGKIFDDFLPEQTYTHWGWVDWDILLGDLSSVVPRALLWQYDAITFPGATLGFAWAGQFSILRNVDEARTLYSGANRWASTCRLLASKLIPQPLGSYCWRNFLHWFDRQPSHPHHAAAPPLRSRAWLSGAGFQDRSWGAAAERLGGARLP